MGIQKIVIENFKGFKDRFTLEFNPKMNILVGDNETGKTTILQAIHLALTGIYEGRNISRALSPYLFNQESVQEYINKVNAHENPLPPSILIEITFEPVDSRFEGNGNLENESNVEGILFKIAFDEVYRKEYEDFIKEEIRSIPIEYYKISWTSFAREIMTPYRFPVRSALIDSSTYRYQNGSDIFVSRIVKTILDDDDIAEIRKANRKMIDAFAGQTIIKRINNKIGDKTASVSGKVELKANQGNMDSWQNNVTTHVSGIPFEYVGKGAQSILKTELALGSKKSEKTSVILLEEPENHLSYSKLNILTDAITRKYQDKQIILSTHSSFVANKLGLDHLILLKNHKTTRINELDSARYFKALAGYDTLRLILCKKAILVEGSSDELVVQRAYMDSHDGKLPIQNGVDVISVNGLSFLRYLEIADKLKIVTAVVSDNDGNIDRVIKKYKDYLEENAKENIKICIDMEVDPGGDLKIDDKPYNYNTLEPKLLKANSLQLFNEIFKKRYKNEDDLRKYMKNNKAVCALAIFESEKRINYPEYIMKAVRDE